MAYPVPHTWYVNGVFLETGAPFSQAYMSYEDTILSTSTREKQTPQRLLDGKTMQTARTMGKVFYFDIPRNDKLLAYWDTVADRLYKIRNSMNIEGVKRTLALFAPPIDPGMLVKARAAGVSISDCLAEASSALPYYRFKVMLAKAFDIVRDVQKVGHELLVAIENNDAEALVQMKASHEQAVVTLSRAVQDLQVTELENLVSIAEGYASKFLQKQIDATKVKIQAEAERKMQEWTMKKTAKQNEAKTIEKKAVTAQIKIQQAQKENEHIEQEIARKAEMYDMLSEKFSSKELYTWMVTELGNIYKTMFRLAVKVARKAEKCYHFEIGDTELGKETQFIKGTGSYWNGLSSGLLAGEALLADLHAMEVAYLDNDRLEQEITVPVSLKEIDCCAFRELQATCSTDVVIPMAYLDMDFPSHYFRRIRSVRMEIECNRGENQVVSAELALIANALNVNNGGDYIENRIGVNAVASSQAQYKNGRFSFDFNSDKYRPFEGAGCDQSTWRITLPQVLKRFNYMDITDIKLYISYTARSGKSDADPIKGWNDNVSEWDEAGMVHEIQLSRDLPELYDDIKNSSETEHILTVEQIKACLPYEADDGDLAAKFWLKGKDAGSMSVSNGSDPKNILATEELTDWVDFEIKSTTSNLTLDVQNLVKTQTFDLIIQILYKLQGET